LLYNPHFKTRNLFFLEATSSRLASLSMAAGSSDLALQLHGIDEPEENKEPESSLFSLFLTSIILSR
jgi:hypothetical protein